MVFYVLAIAALAAAAVVYILGARRRSAAVAPPTPSTPRAPAAEITSAPAVDLTKPIIDYEEDDEVDPTRLKKDAPVVYLGNSALSRIFIDEDAFVDEPTKTNPVIRIEAAARSDSGLRRKRNEDRILARNDHELFVVADGMGGQAGGALASELAVQAINDAFETQTFPESEKTALPRRAAELARAIQVANAAILKRANEEKPLEGMGTTVCAVRFSAKKQRMYVGHVGDSRVYRLRDGVLKQMTSDHTMRAHGMRGDGADQLSRALGVRSRVSIDVVLGKPQPGDTYLICSDGLTKMVDDERIRSVLVSHTSLDEATDELIRLANEGGGKDNVSVILVHVEAAEPTKLAS